jgi:hypothetical protein
VRDKLPEGLIDYKNAIRSKLEAKVSMNQAKSKFIHRKAT